jgi:hypothetical protein
MLKAIALPAGQLIGEHAALLAAVVLAVVLEKATGSRPSWQLNDCRCFDDDDFVCRLLMVLRFDMWEPSLRSLVELTAQLIL